MQIYKGLKELKRCSLVLGFFDCIHPGHEVVLKNAIRDAKENNTQSAVLTFSAHPAEYLHGKNPELILNNEEKCKIFESEGIDNVIFLDFADIAMYTPEEYIENILIKYFSPVSISTGYNHTFGKYGIGNPDVLRKYSKKFGYKYYEIPQVTVDGETVSCTNIRNKLRSGDIYGANKLSGHKFFISGIVKHGDNIAHSLGFPSANIDYPKEKAKIPYGVYFVTVEVRGRLHTGVLNFEAGKITENPSEEKTEVHILNFNENIYGEEIKIFFGSKMRNRIDFESEEKLKEQLKRDCASALIYKEFENVNINISYKKFLM